MPTTAVPPKLTPIWPRPPLAYDRTVLFREPVYQDGQPYTADDGEDGGGE
jgi:hypothetical protein